MDGVYLVQLSTLVYQGRELHRCGAGARLAHLESAIEKVMCGQRCTNPDGSLKVYFEPVRWECGQEWENVH